MEVSTASGGITVPGFAGNNGDETKRADRGCANQRGTVMAPKGFKKGFIGSRH